jgi:dihydroorotate dehydrogenase
VQERLELGADLVQVYSALIFAGPLFFRKVARAQCLLA